MPTGAICGFEFDKRMNPPILFIPGTLCPPAEQQRMHRLIKNSELLMLDHCGHFSTLEKPDEVNAALRNWYLGQSEKN